MKGEEYPLAGHIQNWYYQLAYLSNKLKRLGWQEGIHSQSCIWTIQLVHGRSISHTLKAAICSSIAANQLSVSIQIMGVNQSQTRMPICLSESYWMNGTEQAIMKCQHANILFSLFSHKHSAMTINTLHITHCSIDMTSYDNKHSPHNTQLYWHDFLWQ